MLEFEIIKSKRKTISIAVYKDKSIKVRSPKFVSDKKIKELVLQKKDWILKKLEEFSNLKQENTPKKLEYIDDEEVFLAGKKYILSIINGKKTNSIQIVNDKITIYKKEKSPAKKIFVNWLLRYAKEFFLERLQINFDIFSREFSYNFPVLKVRQMKSRWGSMSSKGEMTLNLELIFSELECIDYVIMHELCHLKYQNHSKKFYDLQSKFTPNYKEIKKKLNSSLKI